MLKYKKKYPDFLTFRREAFSILNPFSEYGDAMFHEGKGKFEFLDSAIRVFTKKKYKYSQILDRVNQQIKLKKKIKIKRSELKKICNKFILLSNYLGYGEKSYPRNLIRLVDLEYKYEMEKDYKKRQEILKEFFEIYDESSTDLLVKAIIFKKLDYLDEALKLCDEAIKKFPDNIDAYGIKAEILEMKAQRARKEGIEREPRDIAIKISYEFGKSIDKLREMYKESLIDIEELIEQFNEVIQDGIKSKNIDISSFKNNVKKFIKRPESLHNQTKIFLYTGEYLIENTPPLLDHGSAAIEFSKAIETEYNEHLLKPFKIHCRKRISENVKRTKKSNNLFNFIYKDKKFTLGNMVYLFKYLRDKKILEKDMILEEFKKYIDSFHKKKYFLGKNSIAQVLTIDSVEKNRNGVAHTEIFTKEKAQITRKWCYKLINMFIESIKWINKNIELIKFT